MQTYRLYAAAVFAALYCISQTEASDGANNLCCTTGSEVLKTGETIMSIQKFVQRVKVKSGDEPCGAYGWGRCSKYEEKDIYAAKYRKEPTYKVVSRKCPPDTGFCCKGYYSINHPDLYGQCFDVSDTERVRLVKESLGIP